MDPLSIFGMIAGGIAFKLISYCHYPTSWLAGALIGYLLAANAALRKTLHKMDMRMHAFEKLLNSQPSALTSRLQAAPVSAASAMPLRSASTPQAKPVSAEANQSDAPATPSDPLMPLRSASSVQAKPVPAEGPRTSRPLPIPPQPEPTIFNDALKEFFLQGNVVLRVGLLILFLGMAFLLKHAAERNVIPIEMRLLGVALAGMGLLAFGWRQRRRRPGFALLVQGGGIGVLYLTIFAASKLYHLVPMPLAFAVMLGLVGASTALALLQDARPLALFGAAGGFLAPVLLSTGSGSHVALFSYYALLNAGILTVAWFKAWRALNLLGFAFTLGIGSLWGLRSYAPELFLSSELFLILFFLMFTGMGVLFAFRQPTNLRGYVDGALIFGTPIASFSLQAAMVARIEYGLAFSALALGLFYVGLAALLWNRGDDRLRQGMRTLTEALLAMGAIFATMAVPMALSGHWTAMAWAMEGSAMVWVGMRQNRSSARNFGLALQLASGLFLLDDGIAGPHLPQTSDMHLGSMVVSLSALFSSWLLHRTDRLRKWEDQHHVVMLVWGSLWWFCSGIREIQQHVPPHLQDHADLLFIGLSCTAMTALAKRLAWHQAAWPSLGLLPFMILAAVDNVGWHGYYPGRHLFADLGWAAWPLAFVLLHGCLRWSQDLLSRTILAVVHVGGFVLLALVATAETSWLVHRLTAGEGVWSTIVWGLVPAALVGLVHLRRLAAFWPLSVHAQLYRLQASASLVLPLWLWLLAGSSNAGSAAPLPFVPLLNPLELGQLAVMLLIVRWCLRHRAAAGLSQPTLIAGGAATAFVWLNSALARSVHQLADVPYGLDAMTDSRLFQTAASILWGLLSLLLMVAADRRRSRPAWLVGSVLTAATVLKLFLVDLAGSGTVERIVSFLAVGLLLMAIGYFSPLPPARQDQEEQP